MLALTSVGQQIAVRRKALGLTQIALARKAGVSRATVDALENGRTGELGFSKVSKILSSVGLELQVQDQKARRPTLEELMNENRDDQSVDRQR